MTNTTKPSKARRGFAAMTPAMRADIAQRGGRAAHAIGTAHEWTPESGAAAGRQGGLTTARDREHMQAIGRKGGLERAARAAAAKAAAL